MKARKWLSHTHTDEHLVSISYSPSSKYRTSLEQFTLSPKLFYSQRKQWDLCPAKGTQMNILIRQTAVLGGILI